MSNDGFHLVVADYLEELGTPEAMCVMRQLRGEEQPRKKAFEYRPPREIDYAPQREFVCVGGAADGRRIQTDKNRIVLHIEPRVPMYLTSPKDFERYAREYQTAHYVRRYMHHEWTRYAFFMDATLPEEQAIPLLLENYRQPENEYGRRR